MLSKIMIDVDHHGKPTIRISNIQSDSKFNHEVRDKLVYRFLKGSRYCVISYSGRDAEIHSMNALDVLQNILDIYSKLIPETENIAGIDKGAIARKDFEQTVFKLCTIIESISSERSTAFENKCVAQEIINGK